MIDELEKAKIDVQNLDNQLLEAINQKIKLSEQLEQWQVSILRDFQVTVLNLNSIITCVHWREEIFGFLFIKCCIWKENEIKLSIPLLYNAMKGLLKPKVTRLLTEFPKV